MSGWVKEETNKKILKKSFYKTFLDSCFLIRSITEAYFRNAYVAQLDSAPAF